MNKIMRNLTKQGISALFFLFSMSAFAQQNISGQFEPYTDSAAIEIVLTGAPAGMVKLLGVYGDENIVKDSALADAAGKVVFKNPERYPAGLYYAAFSGNSFMPFLLDNNQQIFLHSDK